MGNIARAPRTTFFVGGKTLDPFGPPLEGTSKGARGVQGLFARKNRRPRCPRDASHSAALEPRAKIAGKWLPGDYVS